jgi:hypothetical protein
LLESPHPEEFERKQQIAPPLRTLRGEDAGERREVKSRDTDEGHDDDFHHRSLVFFRIFASKCFGCGFFPIE